MTKIFCSWCVASLLVMAVPSVYAQQPITNPTIGFFRSGSAASVAAERKAFIEALQGLGYIEGKNTKIEYRYADGNSKRWPEIVQDLVRNKVNVLVTAGIGPARAAKNATQTIPIVVGTAGDLVRTRLVASLARPGGNVTGVTEISPDYAGKRLELLKEIVPNASTVAVIWHSQSGASDDNEELEAIEFAARDLGLKVVPSGLRDTHELESVYRTITASKPSGAVVLRSSVTIFNRKQLADFAIKARVPSVCDGWDFARDGCLISYGPDLLHNWRRAAVLVDKILKGTKPAEIPVEQPIKFELVINLKAAKQIGLIIPPNVLARADRVIR